jgi:hypothetical protein
MGLKEHKKAYLEGWDGPIYNASTRSLQRTMLECEGIIWTQPLLEIVAEGAGGYTSSYEFCHLVTQDGHLWFARISFISEEDGRAAVLFPFYRKGRSNQPERAIALYAWNMSIDEASHFIDNLRTVMIMVAFIIKEDHLLGRV